MGISRRNDLLSLRRELAIPTLELAYTEEGGIAIHAPHRLLVTGANGQLGRELRNILQDIPAVSADFADKEVLDITDTGQVEAFFHNKHYSHIINCAAYTAVDRAETQPEQCRRVNVDGVANLLDAISDTTTVLVHISTDYVFDGEADRPYTETDTKHPLSVYGQTKSESEDLIMARRPDSIIVRTGWLFSAFGHNFVKTILDRAARGASLRVVNDQTGTPTYAADLAASILRIINHRTSLPGIYHFSNLGQTSWYDFAKTIVAMAGLECIIEPCTTAQYGAPAVRPAMSVLDKTKIINDFDFNIPHWEDALSRCLKEIAKTANTHT